MALTDYKKIIVFDIQTKSAKVITAFNVKVSELAEAVAVAPSGDNIVITGTKSFKIYDEVTEETLGYIGIRRQVRRWSITFKLRYFI